MQLQDRVIFPFFLFLFSFFFSQFATETHTYTETNVHTYRSIKVSTKSNRLVDSPIIRSARRHSPTPRICRSTPASIWASSHIAARFASASLRNYRTCSNIYAPIRETSRISAGILAARRPSPSCPICSRIRAVIRRTNRSSATPATNASRMSHPCWSTYRSTRSPSI